VTEDSLRHRRRWFYVLAAFGIALVHTVVWLGVWSTLVARGEYYGSRVPRSPVLEAIGAILSAPLFYLPERWSLALRPILGDDSSILVVQSALNGIIWGGAIAASAYYVRGRALLNRAAV
jgi:hypothetical protein